MRDILYTCRTSEPRYDLMLRMNLPIVLFWNITPKQDVRRLYLIHLSMIIGWMLCEDVIAIGEEPLILRNCETGAPVMLRNTRRLTTRGPINKIEPNPPHKGFRGFRYFDFRQYAIEQVVRTA